jgi:hypothetical protein
MKNNTLLRILIVLFLYLGIKFFGGEYGRMILYPITLLVTFLHEFGHALGALITGGEVMSIQINPDGSGVTMTRGGSRAVILMGGYIGSAILGNLLFYLGTSWLCMVRQFIYHGLLNDFCINIVFYCQ